MAETSIPTLSSICELATTIVGSPCHFAYNSDVHPFSGGANTVYVLESSSKVKIAIRIPKNRTSPHTPLLVAQEADIRQRIDKAALRLFQPLLGFSSTTDNKLQSPFLALGWVDGKPLEWSANHPAAENERQDILRAVANASLDLAQIKASGVPALTWIESKIKRKIARASSGCLPGATVAECEQQMKLTKKYWMPELNAAPHVLVHGDLSGNNIIVDDHDNSVRGIIDLNWAAFVPLQFAATYPCFLTHEPDRKLGFTTPEHNVERMRRDREFYLQCIERRAMEEQENSILRSYYRILAREDEIPRYWWVAAASRIDIHHAMVRCNWDPKI